MGTVEHVRVSRGDLVFPTLAPETTTQNVVETRYSAGVMSTLPVGQIRLSVLNFKNMHHFGELFVSYLKARHDVFIDQLAWDVPQVDGMEFDQYDTPLARYVIVHEFGEILAGIRLTPTTAQVGSHSYMIRDAQLGLLKGLPNDVLFMEAPVSPQIWEASRLFISSKVDSARRSHIQTLLMASMARAAREVGATHVIGIVPAVFRRWLNRIGMTATPVGPEMKIDAARTCAALFDVTKL